MWEAPQPHAEARKPIKKKTKKKKKTPKDEVVFVPPGTVHHPQDLLQFQVRSVTRSDPMPSPLDAEAPG